MIYLRGKKKLNYKYKIVWMLEKKKLNRIYKNEQK